jgi:glycosyltransferase involved in cell wall biosynthesis
MNVQVLVAAVGQTDHALLERMNIRSDVIVGNQCDRNSVERFKFQGYNAIYLNFAERGVGLNRNNALMRADGDICIFADDDMVYRDDYVQTVTDAFLAHPEADVLVFNLEEPVRTRYVIPKFMRVHYLNYLRYGTARVAFRLRSVRENGIYFNQCFGGGTEHRHGEDNLFLTDCLKKGLKIYAVPAIIARLTEERPSSWNAGYDEAYLADQGALFRAISRRWWRLLCLQDLLRRPYIYKNAGLTFSQARKIMFREKKS